jgi:hypothetical protein
MEGAASIIWNTWMFRSFQTFQVVNNMREAMTSWFGMDPCIIMFHQFFYFILFIRCGCLLRTPLNEILVHHTEPIAGERGLCYRKQGIGCRNGLKERNRSNKCKVCCVAGCWLLQSVSALSLGTQVGMFAPVAKQFLSISRTKSDAISTTSGSPILRILR